MKLLSYDICGMTSVGVLLENGSVADIQRGYEALLQDAGDKNWEQKTRKNNFRDMICLLEAGEEGLEVVRRVKEFSENTEKSQKHRLIVPKESMKILAPVPKPRKITCAGLNYADHVKEQAGREIPKTMPFFAKYVTAINNPGDPVVIPRISKTVDWEAELAVVIGKRGKNIPEENALEYVAGYTPFHDVSVRDYQMASTQYLAGKTFDGHAPMGPYLVLKDEIPDPHILDIKAEVNGKTMQHSNTSNMIFKIPYLISYISNIWTLEPGDILSTGTMAGVGYRMEPKVYLKHGDVVKITIEKLGVLENTFIDEELL